MAQIRKASHTHRKLACLAVLIVLFSPRLVFAQSAAARIVGTVTDPQNASIPSAEVTVTNTVTAISVHLVTDREGYYQALNLPIGPYAVRVVSQGFLTTETAPYTLEINQVLRVDVTMRIGDTSEKVVVSADATQVETVNPTLGASVTSRPIVNLPLNGRNVLDLESLQPGVTPDDPSDSQQGGTVTIAGSRNDSVNYLLDGGMNNSLLHGAAVFIPNPDVVQEFRILTSNYTAEYGRNSGGVVSVVTKSGTNVIHGSAFEFNRNATFAANPYFNNKQGLSNPSLNRNQFGFTAGGPFVKNKLFWFVGYQGQRLGQGQSATFNTFTPDTLSGDFSHAGPNGLPDPGVVKFLQDNPFYQSSPGLAAQGIIDPTKIDPIAQSYIHAKLIPTSPTNAYLCSAGGVCSGVLNSQQDFTDNSNELTGKIDYNPTTNDRFSGTVGGIRDSQVTPFGTAPGYPTAGMRRDYFANLTYVHTFSAKLLNEFHATVQRDYRASRIPTITSYPSP